MVDATGDCDGKAVGESVTGSPTDRPLTCRHRISSQWKTGKACFLESEYSFEHVTSDERKERRDGTGILTWVLDRLFWHALDKVCNADEMTLHKCLGGSETVMTESVRQSVAYQAHAGVGVDVSHGDSKLQNWRIETHGKRVSKK
eukprot:319274-Rhodomonas_salina.2